MERRMIDAWAQRNDPPLPAPKAVVPDVGSAPWDLPSVH